MTVAGSILDLLSNRVQPDFRATPMTYYLRLQFDAAPPGSMIPGCQAHIVVATNLGLEDGSRAVSAQCVGPDELRGAVNQLKAELDEILREGERRFKRAEREWLAERNS
jgi:hypothetical protein